MKIKHNMWILIIAVTFLFSISTMSLLMISNAFTISLNMLIYSGLITSIFIYNNKFKLYVKNNVNNIEQQIYTMVNIIEKRDAYTAGHTQRVADYAVKIAEEMKLETEQIETLRRACMLHDIGKIAIPDSILLKPGKLTDLEYTIIQEHVIVGYELLSTVEIYKDIADIVHAHHEKWDGSGYPLGLKNNQIPFLSQILVISDAFDAMTTNRIYKPRKSVLEAICEIESLDNHFNPDIIPFVRTALINVNIKNDIDQLPHSDLEEERFAYFYKDPVTKSFNKEYLDFLIFNGKCTDLKLSSVDTLSLHNFNQYNNNFGWDNGDKILFKITQALAASDYIFRIYGDDFILLNVESLDTNIFTPILTKILKDTGIAFTFKHIEIDFNKIKSIHELEILIK